MQLVCLRACTAMPSSLDPGTCTLPHRKSVARPPRPGCSCANVVVSELRVRVGGSSEQQLLGRTRAGRERRRASQSFGSK